MLQRHSDRQTARVTQTLIAISLGVPFVIGVKYQPKNRGLRDVFKIPFKEEEEDDHHHHRPSPNSIAQKITTTEPTRQ